MPHVRQVICGCLAPIELAGLMCGVCGLRRIGDDLTASQFEALVEALTPRVEVASRVLRRVRGRKRSSVVRTSF